MSAAPQIGKDIEKAAALLPQVATPYYDVINAGDWLITEPPPIDPFIEAIFEAKDKFAIIGASKMRKSFLLLQLLICLATGMEFLGLKIPKPRRVLLAQFEIKPHHFWRRVRRMCLAIKADYALVRENLRIINGRGKPAKLDAILQIALLWESKVIALDPLYKLHAGNENASHEMAPLLAEFDSMATVSGAAITYIHHDAKGIAEDRDTRDRGSGGNILGRDYDSCFTLSSHRDEPDAVVFEALLRNYPQMKPFVARWENNAFRLAPDLLPIKRTTQSAKQQRNKKHLVPLEHLVPSAIAYVKDKLMGVKVFRETIQPMCGNRDRQRALFELLTAEDGPLAVLEYKSRGKNIARVGLLEHVKDAEQQRLKGLETLGAPKPIRRSSRSKRR